MSVKNLLVGLAVPGTHCLTENTNHHFERHGTSVYVSRVSRSDRGLKHPLDENCSIGGGILTGCQPLQIKQQIQFLNIRTQFKANIVKTSSWGTLKFRSGWKLNTGFKLETKSNSDRLLVWPGGY